MNGADALCETLLAHGIDTCFANPGTSEMHFVSALDRQPRMRCILGLFEGVVTGAADGYGRMADRPSATLLHLGPGLGNGLANLHNAKRGGSPVLNIIGDHATYHLKYDAPLTSDIAAIAGAVSDWVHSTSEADSVSKDTQDAICAAMQPPGKVASLILPADSAWGDTDVVVPPVAFPERRAPDADMIRAAAAAIRADGPNVTLLLGDIALRGVALETAGRIAAATGARLLAEQSNKRLERGAGRVALDRVKYRVSDAMNEFADTKTLILVGAQSPVAFFAYPGQPSTPIDDHTDVLEFAAIDCDLVAALTMLADELGLGDARPAFAPKREKTRPTGRLNAAVVAEIIANILPENAVIVDEAITGGRALYAATQNAAPHDYLQLTGGAIGSGLPMATGAAIACPDRKVISVEADGSGMYTLQALWTQARENLDVVTVILSNRTYAILHSELKNVGANKAGKNASLMLDLDRPELDWCALAKGAGVESARATTAEEFYRLLETATAQRGPFMVEAIL